MTTTTNLRTPTTPRARFDGLPLPVAIGLVIFCLLAIAGLVGKIRSDHATVVQPTPGLIILIATQAAVAPPTAVPPIQVAAIAPNALRRAVVAYDSPNGNVIGAIEQGRAYTVLARFGAEWLQADVTGSGVVWLKADQVLDLPADLVDLAPPPAPAVVYVAVSAPAPAYAAPHAPVVNAPAETAPTPAQEYQAASSERQQAIQQHLANEAIPTIAPMEMNTVNQEWARQQYRSEHP